MNMANEKNEQEPSKGVIQKATDAPRAFTQVLLMLAEGDAHEQLSQDLQRLVKACVAQSRAQVKTVKGSLTLKIGIACDPKGILDLRYDVKLDEPKARRQNTVAWADKAGNVTEKNPRQVELPMGSLRDVSKRGPEVDDVRDEAGVEDV